MWVLGLPKYPIRVVISLSWFSLSGLSFSLCIYKEKNKTNIYFLFHFYILLLQFVTIPHERYALVGFAFLVEQLNR